MLDESLPSVKHLAQAKRDNIILQQCGPANNVRTLSWALNITEMSIKLWVSI
jgi:hypothetical protein